MDGVETSVDAILRGQLRIMQPRVGQRLTTDPLLLADFVRRTARVRARRACDLGSGTGVLALVLARLDPDIHVTGIELQPELVAMAQESARLNGLSDRVRSICADFCAYDPPAEKFDLVIANPPYFSDATGPAAPRDDRALARHEVGCSMDALLRATGRLLAPRGHFAFIYPAERLTELQAASATHGLSLRALRFVHPRADRVASRLLALGRDAGQQRLEIHPPLVLHEGTGWSAEAKALLEGVC